ncbi:MAG: hypothetical protein CVV57_03420 [Tenericutes bacterium HGW-Tenericutes-2]|nr:MAG: hypothetical protein CVV57_03420 [Tenericutes bacterium HGW-Tenericutes-2]
MKKTLMEVTKILNEKFQVIPLLYGSFALEEILKKDYQAHDIDLLIPIEVLKNKIDLIEAFVMNGFTYFNQEVLTFEKNGIEIEISNLEEWIKNSNWDIEENTLIHQDKIQYELLSAKNLEKLYQFLISDKRRSKEKKQKDQEKLNDLKKFLER